MKAVSHKTFHQFKGLPKHALPRSTSQSLCDLRKLQDALVTFCNSTPPDYSQYSIILQHCIDSKAEREGQLVHTHLLKNGIHMNLYLNTKLIVFYGGVSDMLNAHGTFDIMPERSVVSWTALLSGYTQNGHSEEALKVFSEMLRANIKPNQFTYGSALRACTSLMCLDKGKQIQGCIQKGRFIENLIVQSALIDFHSKCGEMEDAYYIFESISERDLISWNAMIGGYAIRGLADGTFQLLRSMLKEGIIPDCFTLANVLKAFTRCDCLIKVSQIHAFVIHLGFISHKVLTGSLINAYAKCGGVRIANSIYNGMLEKDVVSCTALITGYAREGKCSRDALDLFAQIHQRGLGVDDVVLCSMLNICANTASLELGRQLHAFTSKCQANHDVAIGNALVDMYAKSGELEDARCVFGEMTNKNVISWTSLIAGYGKHGNGDKAVALYKQMEREGLKPNDVTFLSLLFACSHAGLIRDGWECFNNMVDKYNILPRAEHYSCMVDLYARGGQLEEAYDMICKTNIKPNSSLWGAILGACNTHGNIFLGEVAAKHLLNMDPQNSVNYVVLSNIYAAAGYWDSARKMRNLIKDKSLRKDPGCSFYQLTNERIVLLPT